MRNSILTRLISHSLMAFLVLLVIAGWTLDSFMTEREYKRLETDLTKSAGTLYALMEKDPAGLRGYLKMLAPIEDVRYTVIDKSGVVLADSRSTPETMDNHATRPEVIKALQGSTGVSQRYSATLGVEMLYVAVATDPVVRVSKPASEVRELLWQIRKRIVTASAVAVALAVLLSYILARNFTVRIKGMEEFALALAEGDYGRPLDTSREDELGRLEVNLDRLRERLNRYVEKLNHDRHQLLTILDGLPDAVVLLGPKQTVDAANRAAIELFALEADSIAGLSKEQVIRNPDVLDKLDAAFRTGAVDNEPTQISWTDPELELSVTLHPVRGDEDRGDGMLLVLRDVSRQAHLERVRSDFIANMAHELRTPLTAIRGAAETLIDAPTGLNEAGKRFVDIIHRHSLRLGNILSDISALAHMESGAMPVTPTEFDAVKTIESAAELFSAEAERSKLKLSVDRGEGPFQVVSDEEKIETILVNLLQNAVRYTPEGGSVVISAKRSGQSGVEFAVADTGIGIPPKSLRRVTERFYRVDPGRSRESGGTGLGLSIVKHLVGVMGGELVIESEHRKGTTVTVRLPGMKRA